MGQEQRGLPGQGTVQAARVHGRGARNERGSRRQAGKLTSSLVATFHGLGRRTGGPDPFKEPSLQAGTDRQTQGHTECHLQSTEPALPWILLEAGEPLISGQRLNTPFK